MWMGSVALACWSCSFSRSRGDVVDPTAAGLGPLWGKVLGGMVPLVDEAMGPAIGWAPWTWILAWGMESMRCIICWSSAICFFNASKSAEEGVPVPVRLAWNSCSFLSTRAFSYSIGAPRLRRRFAVTDRVSMGSVRMNLDRARWILNRFLEEYSV